MALNENWYLTKDSLRVREGDPRAVALLGQKGSTVTPGYPGVEDFAEAPPLTRDELLEFHRNGKIETVKRPLTPEEDAEIVKYVDGKMIGGPPANKSMKGAPRG